MTTLPISLMFAQNEFRILVDTSLESAQPFEYSCKKKIELDDQAEQILNLSKYLNK